MAKTDDQLFNAFAARVAEILRERFDIDPEALLRTRRELFTLEGLINRSGGGPEWYGVRATPEQLQWTGPNEMAEAFVDQYMAAFRNAQGS